MTALQSSYGTHTQVLTLTGTSLANNGARESTVVDNTTDKFTGALVQVKTKTGASGVSATGIINVYAYGTVTNGTNYSGGATGSDAGITLTAPPNHRLIGSFAAVANATAYTSPLFNVEAAFGGVLPAKWGVILENRTGAALSSTAGDHVLNWQGCEGESV